MSAREGAACTSAHPRQRFPRGRQQVLARLEPREGYGGSKEKGLQDGMKRNATPLEKGSGVPVTQAGRGGAAFSHQRRKT